MKDPALPHAHTIKEKTDQAESAAKRGDRRQAARAYQELGNHLKTALGPHHPLTLDAYENMARCVKGGWS